MTFACKRLFLYCSIVRLFPLLLQPIFITYNCSSGGLTGAGIQTVKFPAAITKHGARWGL